MLSAMGMHDEPLGHGEVSFDDVRVPLANVLLGPGRAFEIAQGRLGPGRVHHCMRLVGLAEMALELAVRRATDAHRVRQAARQARRQRASASPTPGSPSTRPGCWCCTPPGSSTPAGSRGALSEVSQIKVAVPNMAQQVIDMAMQLHGGARLRRGASARRGLGQRPVAADGRRPRRGAPRRDRQARAGEVPMRVLVTGGASGLGAALVNALRRPRRPGALRRPVSACRRSGRSSTLTTRWCDRRLDVTLRGRLGRRRRVGRRRVGRPRHPGQQRRRRGRRPHRAVLARGLAVDLRHQPVRRGPRHPRVRADAQGAGLRPDREHRLARRPRAPAGDGLLQRGQGRRRGVQRDRRARARAVRRRRARPSARRTSGRT